MNLKRKLNIKYLENKYNVRIKFEEETHQYKVFDSVGMLIFIKKRLCDVKYCLFYTF